MKLLHVERLSESKTFVITKAKFKTFWGKEFTTLCFTPKVGIGTYFLNSGETIPVRLWDPFKVFIESDHDKLDLA